MCGSSSGATGPTHSPSGSYLDFSDGGFSAAISVGFCWAPLCSRARSSVDGRLIPFSRPSVAHGQRLRGGPLEGRDQRLGQRSGMTPERTIEDAASCGTLMVVTDLEKHEQGLAQFVTGEWRSRFRESLASPRRRDKLRSQLPHF